jgi:hypothetical protein
MNTGGDYEAEKSVSCAVKGCTLTAKLTGPAHTRHRLPPVPRRGPAPVQHGVRPWHSGSIRAPFVIGSRPPFPPRWS